MPIGPLQIVEMTTLWCPNCNAMTRYMVMPHRRPVCLDCVPEVSALEPRRYEAGLVIGGVLVHSFEVPPKPQDTASQDAKRDEESN
jgi:hypothetical protein